MLAQTDGRKKERALALAAAWALDAPKTLFQMPRATTQVFMTDRRYAGAIDMFQPAQELFRSTFGEEPAMVAFAPGRVNLIGEHTDYNDGFVLPAAIDLGVAIALSPTGSGRCEMVSREGGRAEPFEVPAALQRIPKGWAKYPASVAWAIGAKSGIKASVVSGLPFGGGLSSSAALELAFATAWNSLDSLGHSPAGLALLCQKAENEGVGVPCGAMDLLASALGESGKALFIDTRTLKVEPVEIPPSLSLLVCHTGKERALAGSAYADRRRSCEAACRTLGIASLRDATLDDLAKIPDPIVRARATHVVSENIRVQDFVKALVSGNFAGIARLMAESHNSLRDLYEVSCLELDSMVQCCVETEGVVGARMTGAGFGGACVALVEKSVSGTAAKRIAGLYNSRIASLECQVSVVEPSRGARIGETGDDDGD